MKISYNWLKEYLDLPLSIEEISVMLTDTGLEIEGIEKVESVKGGLNGIVIGEVKHCEQHPNAEKLSITKVDVGSGEELQIVCGAPNVAAGQKVPVATIGAVLYSGDESFTIKKSKLRGELSQGMICAEDELGLGTSHDGIMVLDAKAEIGKPAREYFGITDDYVLEIGLTPNRTDAMSHLGVARDLLAAYKHKNPETADIQVSYPKVDDFAVDNEKLDILVEVEDTEACPRYSGLTISGVKVDESPEWIKKRLNAIGLRPLNNIVDITNYVLWETGYPLHAFDAKEITGGKVIVKKSPKGTKFTTLDDVERELSGNDLMICNTEAPMCIGGVFGGIKSGVTEKTSRIFLESACFDPATIRKTARAHNLQTDASFRFERGIDPEGVIYALKRAAMLIKKIAGGEISSQIKDSYPNPKDKAEITLNISKFNKLTGKDIPVNESLNILKNLDFEIKEIEKDKEYLLTTPGYRVDVTRPADVYEEILRIYGYNSIETDHHIHSAINHAKKPDDENLRYQLSSFLSANSFYEIMNNSLTKGAFFTKNNLAAEEEVVKVYNPLSSDLDILRPGLLAGGLESLRYNINRKSANLSFFEFGKTYHLNQAKADANEPLKKYSEEMHLALFMSGNKFEESWKNEERSFDFFDLKVMVHKIISRLSLDNRKIKSDNLKTPCFQQAMTYSLNNKCIVNFGQVNSQILDAAEIKQEVYFADFHWGNVLELLNINDKQFEGIPKFPEVRRDLSMLIPAHVTYEQIRELAFKSERNILKDMGLFDIYQDEKIGKDKKSYAVKFILQDKNKTLTDKIIDKTMKRLVHAFRQNLGAELR